MLACAGSGMLCARRNGVALPVRFARFDRRTTGDKHDGSFRHLGQGVIGILGYFGFETTSFAALIAALGIAIGAAWGGLLSNFAAGAFILVLRPFKVGDYVLVGGVEGTVRAIGLFTTSIDSPDNVLTSVGNAAVMGGTIKNFSHNPYRRVELTAQLDHTVDPHDAIRRLKAALPAIANVVKDPAPDVEILTFNERGPVLAVRPYVNTVHDWQVYFDTN